MFWWGEEEVGILSLLCLMCGPIPWLMIALADTAEMPFSQRQHQHPTRRK